MRPRTAVHLIVAAALMVLATFLAPAPTSAAACDPAACNQTCVRAGFDGGACISGRCFCFIITP